MVRRWWFAGGCGLGPTRSSASFSATTRTVLPTATATSFDLLLHAEAVDVDAAQLTAALCTRAATGNQPTPQAITIPDGWAQGYVSTADRTPSPPHYATSKLPAKSSTRAWSASYPATGLQGTVVSPAECGGAKTFTPAASTASTVKAVAVPPSSSASPAGPNSAIPDGRVRWSWRS